MTVTGPATATSVELCPPHPRLPRSTSAPSSSSSSCSLFINNDKNDTNDVNEEDVSVNHIIIHRNEAVTEAEGSGFPEVILSRFRTAKSLLG